MQELYDQLMDAYNQLKRDIRAKDKHLYNRWKAGGFLVDDDIVSMYPSLGTVVETLTEDEDPEE